MHSLVSEIETHPKNYLQWIVGFEVIFLLLILKSFTLSLVFVFLILGILLIIRFPEFGLAVALTSNVILKVILDNLKTNIPTPVLIIYILLLVSGAFVVMFTKAPGRKFAIGKLIPISFLMFLLMVVCLKFSPDKTNGAEKILFFLLFNTLLLVFPMIFREDFPKIENLFFFTYFVGLLLGVFSTIFAQNIPIQIRFSPSDSVNPIWLARSLGVSIIAGSFYFFKFKRLLPKILILSSLPFFIYPMIRTGSRGPFIGLIGSLLFIYFLQQHQFLAKKVIVSLTAIITTIIYFIISGSTVAARFSDPTRSDVASTVSRIGAWMQAISDFMSSPLLGIGTGGFKLELFFISFTYPHNLFLEFACENGILGLILIAAFVTLAIKYGLNNIKCYRKFHRLIPTQLSIIAMAIFIFALWNSMFSGSVVDNEIVWFGAGLIWVLNISLPASIKNENERRK